MGFTKKVSLSLVAMVISSASFAGDWEYRVGYGSVNLGDVSANSVKLNGGVVPGGDATAANNNTLLFDVSRRLGESKWKARFFGGIPPEATLKGAGALAGVGKLGKIKYAPAVLSATYDLPKLGKIQPYIGGGVNYTIVFGEKDLALSNLQVSNGLAPVIQIGADMALANGWSVGLDVRKIYLDVDATAKLGADDVKVDLQVDPLVVFLSVGKTF
jgi:outer membrane protein